MDIVERTVDLLDRAQGHMTAVTQQAARRVRNASEISALDGRLSVLRTQLEESVTEVGKLTFRQWKNNGAGQADAIDALCRAIDTMNGEYQRLLGELADLKASAVISTVRPGIIHSSGYIALPPLQSAPASDEPAAEGMESPDYGRFTDAQRAGVGAASFEQTKPCPECLVEVPVSQRYCPSCGMRTW
jgi:hypothetical protein